MIHIITGQTATGKTAYALKRAEDLNGELINADARQMYKKLDIITGKDVDKTTGTFTVWKKMKNMEIGFYEFLPPTSYNLQPMKLWLYDIIEPSISFSSVEYAELARMVIDDILSRGKTPIFVGGTFFYLQQLLYASSKNRVPSDEKLRDELSHKSITELQQILSDKNLILFRSLNNSERHNPQRMIRRIEIEMSEKSSHVKEVSAFPYEVSLEGFEFASKSRLRDVITHRVDQRLEDGAVKEVEDLLKMYDTSAPGMNAIGYTQIGSYLAREMSFDEMRSDWITKEVQYAKRQLTLMKRDEHISWHEV